MNADAPRSAERPAPAASATADAPPIPTGDYVSARIADNLVFTAGMTPKGTHGLLTVGRLGDAITTARGAELAATAARRAVAAAREAADRQGRTLTDPVAMTVYVAATPTFTEHTAVADGASSALRHELGDIALPARAAVGVASLPGGSSVEVQLIVALAPPDDASGAGVAER
ncbi:RidA family protein [Micromonospora sp. NPDC047740]|uniref:RidA family protein n=1 Tax=Micromonospora sp. NPDC047740 TaxID=3364254 RepID=UPI003710F2EE